MNANQAIKRMRGVIRLKRLAQMRAAKEGKK